MATKDHPVTLCSRTYSGAWVCVWAKEDNVPYPPEHRTRTRARIVRSAQALFNRHGFSAVSIDDLMKEAGLTRGGFYSYFRSKEQLYAEAVALSLDVTPWSRWDGVSVDFAAHDAARQVIDAYLSREHFDDVEGSCPMVTLPGDVSRSGKVVKDAFERVFLAMAGLFEETLKREGRPDRRRAVAITEICVGAMVVARSVASPEVADAILDAARVTALSMGGWTEAARKGATARRRPNRARRK
jgi:AcrR family transcriptional regulator